MLGDAHQRGEVAGRQAAPLPGVEDQQPLLGRHGRLGQISARLDQPPALVLAGSDQPRLPQRLLEGLLGEGLFVQEVIRHFRLLQRVGQGRLGPRRGGDGRTGFSGRGNNRGMVPGGGLGGGLAPGRRRRWQLRSGYALAPLPASSLLALALSQTCLTPLRSNRSRRRQLLYLFISIHRQAFRHAGQARLEPQEYGRHGCRDTALGGVDETQGRPAQWHEGHRRKRREASTGVAELQGGEVAAELWRRGSHYENGLSNEKSALCLHVRFCRPCNRSLLWGRRTAKRTDRRREEGRLRVAVQRPRPSRMGTTRKLES